MWSPDPAVALDASVRLAALASFVATLEMLAVRHEFTSTGVFSRDAVGALYWDRAASVCLLDHATWSLLVIQGLTSAALVVTGPLSAVGTATLGLCVVSRGLVRWRRLLGGDGAEQITSIVLVAGFLAVFPVPSRGRIVLAVAFIGAQLVLSYFTAGVAKFVSPIWRKGDALPGIMATEFHGDPVMARLLRQLPALALVLCWVTILFECLFPLALFAPPWVAYAALAMGLGFHLACAVTMGLNNFLLAFTATYPCVLALRGMLERL